MSAAGSQIKKNHDIYFGGIESSEKSSNLPNYSSKKASKFF